MPWSAHRDLLRSASMELTDTMKRLDHLLTGDKLKFGVPTAANMAYGEIIDPQSGHPAHSVRGCPSKRRGNSSNPTAHCSSTAAAVIRMDVADHQAHRQ